LAAVQPDGDLAGTSPLVIPQSIGLGAIIRPAHSGTLYLRTNVSDGELDATGGTLSVQIARR